MAKKNGFAWGYDPTRVKQTPIYIYIANNPSKETLESQKIDQFGLSISELGPVCPVEGKKTSPVLGSGVFWGPQKIAIFEVPGF